MAPGRSEPWFRVHGGFRGLGFKQGVSFRGSCIEGYPCFVGFSSPPKQYILLPSSSSPFMCI